MLALGTTAPDFRLPDTSGKIVALGDFKSAPALAVLFICNHCPYVQHIRSGLAQFGRDYQPRGAAIVAISANDIETHPQDSPAKMAQEAKAAGYTFPYLYDETQEVAKAYQAACTPDIFLFDKDRKLVYRGQFDASRPGNGIPVTGKDLRAAMDAVLAGRPVSERQTPRHGLQHQVETRPRAKVLLAIFPIIPILPIHFPTVSEGTTVAACTSRPNRGISGQYHATAATTKTVAIPPETTEKTGPRYCATKPDSKPPSSLEVPINRLFTDETRPRIASGVSNCTSVCRTITLMLSAHPQTNSQNTEGQNHRE